VAIAVVGYFWFTREQEPEPVEDPVVLQEEEWEPFWEAEAESPPEPRYRVPEPAPPPPRPVVEDVEVEDQRPIEDVVIEEQEAPEPLPPLIESDEPLREALAEIADERQLWELFIPEFLIRHFVVTIDNMTAPKLPQQFSFAEPPAGQFAVREANDETYHMDPRNFDRYRRYVEFAESVEIGRAVALYVRFYPLFQRAYEELGYPHGYFNDRLVEVIDHLLQTPDVKEPIELVRPKVYYEFADARLEALSAGQKLVLRTGPDNSARIKSVLRDLRAELTAMAAEAGGVEESGEYVPPPP
jgi:hypothetical protein